MKGEFVSHTVSYVPTFLSCLAADVSHPPSDFKGKKHPTGPGGDTSRSIQRLRGPTVCPFSLLYILYPINRLVIVTYLLHGPANSTRRWQPRILETLLNSTRSSVLSACGTKLKKTDRSLTAKKKRRNNNGQDGEVLRECFFL